MSQIVKCGRGPIAVAFGSQYRQALLVEVRGLIGVTPEALRIGDSRHRLGEEDPITGHAASVP
jgi:hypothetical protein